MSLVFAAFNMEKIEETELVTTLVLAASVVGGRAYAKDVKGRRSEGQFPTESSSGLGSRDSIPIGVNLQLGIPEQMKHMNNEEIEKIGKDERKKDRQKGTERERERERETRDNLVNEKGEIEEKQAESK